MWNAHQPLRLDAGTLMTNASLLTLWTPCRVMDFGFGLNFSVGALVRKSAFSAIKNVRNDVKRTHEIF